MAHPVDAVQTPTLEKLSALSEERMALVEFLTEFLPSKNMALHQMSEGLTDLRPCRGPRGRLDDDCPGEGCTKCGGRGVYEISIEDRYLPYGGNVEDLVFEYLGLDPKVIEAERRALLDALG